jgi:hypothetical protein
MSRRVIDYDDLPLIIQKYISDNNIPIDAIGAEPILIEVVKHMYTQCNSLVSFPNYKELEKEIIKLLDKTPTSDLYYKDIDTKQSNYIIVRGGETDIIEFIPIGGKKSKRKKTKKNKSKNKY